MDVVFLLPSPHSNSMEGEGKGAQSGMGGVGASSHQMEASIELISAVD